MVIRMILLTANKWDICIGVFYGKNITKQLWVKETVIKGEFQEPTRESTEMGVEGRMPIEGERWRGWKAGG